MSTTIDNLPSARLWTFEVPDLTISTSENSLDLEVRCGYDVLLASVLYPYNGEVVLRELSELIERYMFDNSKVVAEISVVMNPGSSETELGAMSCVMNFGITDCTLDNFLSYSFLTTSRVRSLVPGIADRLTFVADDGETPEAQYKIITRVDAEIAIVVETESITLDSDNVGYVEVSLDSLREMADGVDVIGCTLYVGSRVAEFYKPSNAALLRSFRFVNYFGVEDVATFGCVNTSKQEGSRVVSSVARRSVLSHLTHVVEYDIETTALSPAECVTMAQLFESPQVSLADSSLPIVITERTWEISDERGAAQRVKFTYREQLPRHRFAFARVEDPGIFTGEYDESYG